MRWMTLVLAAMCLTCASASAPIKVSASADLESNASREETAVAIQSAVRGLQSRLEAGEAATRGGLRRAVLNSVRIDGNLAFVGGCGTFYDTILPERFAIGLVLVRQASGWELHSWQVETDELHGPPEPCH